MVRAYPGGPGPEARVGSRKDRARRIAQLEILYFTVAAIALYFVSDWILKRIEVALGRRLENRSVVFLFILLTLAITSFAVIRQLGGE